ncbi:MAG: glycosyltransferase [Deltaproteobacteria bacterium]|nr:glycosyltransferase [Deltaproteobacteria bacterium]
MKKLRIFLVMGARATSIAGSEIWLRNFYDPLVSMGHDVRLYDIDAFLLSHNEVSMSQKAKELLSNELPIIFGQEHEKKGFDIFLSYLHSGQIEPDVFKEIKKKVLTVNYTTNFHQFSLYEDIARNVDINIYVSTVAKGAFDKTGVQSYWMPFAANPAFYKPSKLKTQDIVFVGQPYGIRPYLFWRVLQYGVNLHLHGNGWQVPSRRYNPSLLKNTIKKTMNSLGLNITKYYGDSIDKTLQHLDSDLRDRIILKVNMDYPRHVHSALNDDEYTQCLAQASGVINVAESRFNHDFLDHHVLYGSNLRDFETTMSGTFLCTQYSDEIASLFDINKEICCYHNEHDLAEKLGYYIKHETSRENIANAGYKRAIQEHTWTRRFKDFFDHIYLAA